VAEIPITLSAAEHLHTIIDRYCEYFLCGDGSEAERAALDALEQAIAEAGFDVRGDHFLTEYDAGRTLLGGTDAEIGPQEEGE